MIFKEIPNDATWNVYKKIIGRNMKEMDDIKIPNFLIVSFVKLISFYPFDEKQERTFFNLDKRKRIPYLFKYLIKQMRINGMNKSQIDFLVRMKDRYDKSIKHKISDAEKTDRTKIYLLSEDYKSMVDLYLEDVNINKKFIDLSKSIQLMVDSLIDEKMLLIKKNNKKWKINNKEKKCLEPEIYFSASQNNHIKKSYSKKMIYDIWNEIHNTSDEVSMLDKFIESEVQKRLKKEIDNRSVKKTEKKRKRSIYDVYSAPDNSSIPDAKNVFTKSYYRVGVSNLDGR